MGKLAIRQGDQIPYSFPIFFRNAILSEDDIEDIEVSIGTFLRKTYLDGDIVYDDLQNYFIMYLTQEDTFSLLPSKSSKGKYFEYPMLIRVKLKDYEGLQNYIFTIPGPNVEVLESLSKERL